MSIFERILMGILIGACLVMAVVIFTESVNIVTQKIYINLNMDK